PVLQRHAGDLAPSDSADACSACSHRQPCPAQSPGQRSPPGSLAVRVARHRAAQGLKLSILHAGFRFNTLLRISAASVPIHLGGRIVPRSTRTSRSVSSTATIVFAGLPIEQLVSPPLLRPLRASISSSERGLPSATVSSAVPANNSKALCIFDGAT